MQAIGLAAYICAAFRSHQTTINFALSPRCAANQPLFGVENKGEKWLVASIFCFRFAVFARPSSGMEAVGVVRSRRPASGMKLCNARLRLVR
jgi:hypothetical protein